MYNIQKAVPGGGRFIFGGNAEAIFRTERDGFRMGHEQRLSTDLEYVFPRDPHKPGGELFLILETTFVHRSNGQLDGLTVTDSKATEYYLAPGLSTPRIRALWSRAAFNFQ